MTRSFSSELRSSSSMRLRSVTSFRRATNPATFPCLSRIASQAISPANTLPSLRTILNVSVSNMAFWATRVLAISLTTICWSSSKTNFSALLPTRSSRLYPVMLNTALLTSVTLPSRSTTTIPSLAELNVTRSFSSELRSSSSMRLRSEISRDIPMKPAGFPLLSFTIATLNSPSNSLPVVAISLYSVLPEG